MANIKDIIDERYSNVEWAMANKDISYDIDGVYNRKEAAGLIAEDLRLHKSVLIHADVDMDGIGAAYVIYKYILKAYKGIKIGVVINGERNHGISDTIVEYANREFKNSLVLILDSSSSMISDIKRIQADVVVIDHHELTNDIGANELKGYTDDKHRYVIATNMYSKDGNIDRDMSGCMVTYSIVQRMATETIGMQQLEEMNLSQWVGVTLLSDVIGTNNKRNQFYMEKIVGLHSLENNLNTIFEVLGGYRFNKNFINYIMVPLINSSIRIGNSRNALYYTLSKPSEFIKLRDSKIEQDKILSELEASVENNIETFGDVLLIKNVGKKSFNGLLASRLMSKYKKTVIAYNENMDGKYVGSFRGINPSGDYLKLFECIGAIAKGHRCAGGIEITREQLESLIGINIDDTKDNIVIDIGKNSCNSLYEIDNINEFKTSGYYYKLAVINSRCSSKEEINFRCICEPRLINFHGKVHKFDVGDLDNVTGFSSGYTYGIHEVYVELNGNNIEKYIKY